MKNIFAVSVVVFLFQPSAFAAPNPAAVNPEPPVPLIKVTLHKLENGEKKSSQSISALAGTSAETFSVANNKTFERNFFNPELMADGKVRLRLHQCSGLVTAEELKNPSSINCDPAKMNRMNFEASFSKPTIVEATGPNGEKQEYFLFVEKMPVGGPATSSPSEPMTTL